MLGTLLVSVAVSFEKPPLPEACLAAWSPAVGLTNPTSPPVSPCLPVFLHWQPSPWLLQNSCIAVVLQCIMENNDLQSIHVGIFGVAKETNKYDCLYMAAE